MQTAAAKLFVSAINSTVSSHRQLHARLDTQQLQAAIQTRFNMDYIYLAYPVASCFDF